MIISQHATSSTSEICHAFSHNAPKQFSRLSGSSLYAAVNFLVWKQK